jgi:hypothetical protein
VGGTCYAASRFSPLSKIFARIYSQSRISMYVFTYA